MVDNQQNYGVVYDRNDYAGFFKRVAIALIDFSVVCLVVVAVFFATTFLNLDDDDFLALNYIWAVVFSIGYLGLLRRSRFRTLGYIIANVKIVDLKGNRPSAFKMILRTGLLILGPFEFFIDIAWLTSEITKQTLRDKYVGTYVVAMDASPVGRGTLKTVTLGVMGWSLMYKEVKDIQYS